MGLFSSSKKTYVGTSVSRVIEDKLLPNSVKQGTIQAILEKENIPKSVLDELTENIGVKAERYHRQAEKIYPYGMPYETQFSEITGENEARDVIQGIIGEAVSIDYSIISAFNPIHYGWEYLVNSLKYDSNTNTLHGSSNSESPIYLWDLYLAVPSINNIPQDSPLLANYGIAAVAGEVPVYRPYKFLMDSVIPPTPPVQSKEVTALSLFYITTEVKKKVPKSIHGGTVLSQNTIQIPLPAYGGDYDPDKLYVGYRTSSGKRGYWSYALGSGKHPSLDALVKSPTGISTGKHFPFMYFRFDKTSADKSPNTPAYKASKKLLNTLGMNFQETIEAIHENPDIKDVEQAMMIFAVPPSTDDPILARYLFEYFSAMYGRQPDKPITHTVSSSRYSSALYNRGTPVNVVEIRDARFRMTLGNQGISKKLERGNIGPVGHHIHEVGTVKLDRAYTVVDAEGYPTNDVEFAPITFPTHVYKKQVTAHIVEVVSVMQLSHTYHIWDGYQKVGYDEDDIILVPLDMSLTKKYTLVEKEHLYAKAMQFVFNSRVTQKVKWYQKGWFSIFVVVVAVALVVITQGAALSAWAGMLASGGAATTLALKALVKTLFKTLIVTFATKIAAKELGADFALITAALLIAAGAVDVLASGSLESAVWAGDLITGANGLINAAGDVVQDNLLGLQSEYSEFQRYAEEALKTLESSNELLYSSPILSPFILFGESPRDYYNRSLGSKNPGILAISSVKNYTKTALKLPSIQESLQGFNHGI